MTAFGGFLGGEERSRAAISRHHVQAGFGRYPLYPLSRCHHFYRCHRFFYRDAIPPRLREPS